MSTFPVAPPWAVPGGSEAALRMRARQLRLHIAVHPVLHLDCAGRPSSTAMCTRRVAERRIRLVHPRTLSRG
jgi:hypothetical protein